VLSRFFIDRPIFAAVLSIVITLAGALSLYSLPLAQFPSVTPPTVQVTCTYPGASAKEVADAVASPIEQQVNGVENMMFMSSQCANDGTYNLTVTFHTGVNLDMAQVMVQNRVNLAVPQLPEVIRQTGVTTQKKSPDILMGLALNSPDGRYDQLYLSNYALMQIKDELVRIQGVGDIFLFGQRDYSMRVWVDPHKFTARGLSTADVVRAIREENNTVAIGSVGQEPMHGQQAQQVPLSTLGRLTAEEQFGEIVLKTGPDRQLVKLRDVARLELSSKSSNIGVRMDGKPTVFLAVFQMPGANALDVRRSVLEKMDELKRDFPEGVDYEIGFDTTPYTEESIREVVHTLRDAIILVACVVLLFLQNWRSTIIPLVAVPVAIIGTFAAMAVFGFSLNNLTLFGLVLAIGIVVDDAIVVVEAVEHHIEHGLAPREATIKAMEQVSGPVIAVGLVLSAVFVPCAFISGITGAFFRQFALTIAVSTIISTFNSLTLSPALAAILLKPLPKGTRRENPLPRLAFVILGGWLGWKYLAPQLAPYLVPYIDVPGVNVPLDELVPGLIAGAAGLLGWYVGQPLNWLLGLSFRAFNSGFRMATSGYVRLVGGMLRVSVLALLVYTGLLGLTYFRIMVTPRGFIPQQDMGYLFCNVQLPDSASMRRTDEVMRQIEQIGLSTPGVRHVSAISGQSFVLSAAGSNFGTLFINLKPYPERRTPALSAVAISQQLQMRANKEISGAMVQFFPPPPVRGVGRAGGFALMIEDRADLGPQKLQQEVDKLTRAGMFPDPEQTPWLMGGPDGKMSKLVMLFSVFRANVPQLRIVPDPRAVMMRGVSLQDFNDTLQVYTGSFYVNDFNLFGRTWQVIVQAESSYRDEVEDLARLTVRSSRGRMVPLGTLADVRQINGPLVLTRYNMYPAAAINGIAAPGISSGETRAILERLSDMTLTRGMAYEWTDMSYLEVTAGNTAILIFVYAVLMVFLVLAAQYESWALPMAVILVVPMCLLSAITAVNIAEMDINIFTQVGFVVLVGLASKNAILIVEFARQQRHEGQGRREATLAACRLRLRPIVMTSLAFILGVVPLLVSTGAGAEMRKTLGTAVFGGMVGVTLFGIVMTPVFFFTIDWLGDTHLLRHRWVQSFVSLTLNLFTLRGVRKLAGSLIQRKAPTRVVAVDNGPTVNGEGNHKHAIKSDADRDARK
jgi:multidrug efflux pump